MTFPALIIAPTECDAFAGAKSSSKPADSSSKTSCGRKFNKHSEELKGIELILHYIHSESMWSLLTVICFHVQQKEILARNKIF